MFELLNSRRVLWEHLKILKEDHDLNILVAALHKVSYNDKKNHNINEDIINLGFTEAIFIKL